MSVISNFGTKFKSLVHRSPSQSLLRNSFLVAGFLFIAVCIIGVITKAIIDSTGEISSYLQDRTRWNTDFLVSSQDATKMRIIFGIGAGMILVSSITTLIWAFRVDRTSLVFIAFNYLFYAVAQGIGFGALFMVFKASELIAVFGIAGGIFIVMGVIGMIVKNGERLMPYIIGGSIVAIILGLVSLILYFVGVYNDTLVMFMTVFSGVLACLWIVFDVWMIKRTSQYMSMNGNTDPMMRLRLTAWFGFKLASDLITLVWTVARIYLRAR